MNKILTTLLLTCSLNSYGCPLDVKTESWMLLKQSVVQFKTTSNHNVIANTTITLDGTPSGRKQTNRIYDCQGSFVASLSNDTIYDNSGNILYRYSNNSVYNKNGQLVYKFQNNRVYNTSGAFVGEFR